MKMMMQEQPLMETLTVGEAHHGGLLDRRLAPHHPMDDEPPPPPQQQHLLQSHNPHHAGSPPSINLWQQGHHLMMADGVGDGFVGTHHGLMAHHQDMMAGSSASSSSGSSGGGGARGSPPLVGSLGVMPGPRKQASSSAASKKGSSRRNAWGNLSYADLITQAIQSAPEKRLTLSQVYEWMVANIPYFKDKGDSNSSAGWKNSIRHNLSLHSRFVRVQNEGTGKSSWWMLNPDAKPGGKTSRRRTPSVDGAGNPIGPRGLDFKRRGRTKKSGTAARNGNQGNGSPSSPGLTPGGATHLHVMSEVFEDARGLHGQYPFSTDLRNHLGGVAGEYGGRMSPPPNVRDGPYGYPGQEPWPSEYPPCGMQGYFPGNIPRSFCEQLCPDGDYGCTRPGSPGLIQGRPNGNPSYRHYQANGVTGDNFHHYDGKMPSSPLVGVPPHSLPQEHQPHNYSNIQVMSPGPPSMSPSCQRPPNFPSPETNAFQTYGPDSPSQSSGDPPIMSPHPLHHGGSSASSFFPNCNINKSLKQNGSPPSTPTPSSKGCTNASILERALGTAIKQEQVVASAVMAPAPGQWTHLGAQGHPNFSEVDDYMKPDPGMDNMEYMYHSGPPGGQNVSPSMSHLPPPSHSAGSRTGEAGPYHHTLSNWVR